MSEPYPQYPPGPYAPQPPPPRNAMAGWALGLAITALVVAIAALLFAAMAAFGPLLVGPSDYATEGRVSDLNDLAEGECFTAVTLRPETTEAMSCQGSHDGEVYLKELLGDEFGGEYPGREELFWAVDDACYSEFERYTGEAFEDSTIGYALYGPDQESWSQGDREIACALSPYRIGSLQGSAHGG
ncbi:MAG: septum formation family protein [Ornithinimicrobium sp.]